MSKKVKELMIRFNSNWWRPEDKDYWSFHKEALIQRRFVFRNFRNIKNANFLIDIGCGPGRFLKLAKKVENLVMIDISKAMLNLACDKARQLEIANKVHFVMADAEALPLRNEVGDIILCIQTFIHLPNHKVAFNELFRLTKCRGTIVIDVIFKNFVRDIIQALRYEGIKTLLGLLLRKANLLEQTAFPIKQKRFLELIHDRLRLVRSIKIHNWNIFILEKSLIK